MEFTEEQKRFYEKVEHLGEEDQNRILCEARECVRNTGFNYTLSLINGKYKMTILYTIGQFGTIRTNEMQLYIADISFKTLSANLKELERDELIIRKEYHQVPPKVEYSLTKKGETLLPILNAMCAWGYMHRDEGRMYGPFPSGRRYSRKL